MSALWEGISAMIVYLASFKTIEKHYKKNTRDIYLLSSFAEHLSGNFGGYVLQEKHIVDSGAFSAMTGTLKNISWEEYTLKYMNFLRKTKQELFFELDIDSIVGYEKVKKYREIIEQGTGKPCIPVWHRTRGKNEWLNLTEKYNYVAVGGFVTKEIKKTEYPIILPWLLATAKRNNCRVHGLGFTGFKDLPKYKFYSVDSTTWVNGCRFGEMVFFNKGRMKKYSRSGYRVKDNYKAHIHNFEEWVKYQKYALLNL